MTPRLCRIFIGLFVVGLMPASWPSMVAAVSTTNPLVWEAASQTYSGHAEEEAHTFSFVVKNTDSQPVAISEIVPSCGCTVAQLPATPWVLAPGETGKAQATLHFAERAGVITKSLTVRSSAGTQMLAIQVILPPRRVSEPSLATVSRNAQGAVNANFRAPPATTIASREQNQTIARNNRQAVFLGNCAQCHAKPAEAKTGHALFTAACAICHESPQRASQVPDLAAWRGHRDDSYWRERISEGVPSSMMPAFAHRNGGPLSAEQIETLVEFLRHE